ncbi:MAG: hypothetical protein ABL908_17360 [Hyphomicrobium sp.]
MAFLASKNDRLDPRFKTIARHYKLHGERWKVRWDYAFFQMALETNFLAFARPDGRPGDVRPTQNNFAGLGTTGGGVPGDSYPDVSTGVLAQIQHLVAYSGELMPSPVGPRTRLKQDDIVSASLRVGRPIHFADLARRWAVDPRYGRSIEWVAERFREAHCAGRDAASAPLAVTTRQTALVSGSQTQRSSLGGEPTLVRKPAIVRADTAVPHGVTANSPAVRTVWSRSKVGDVPELPMSGPTPAPRRVTAVAAGSAVRAATMVTQPVTQPLAVPLLPPSAAIAPMPASPIVPMAPQTPSAIAPAAEPEGQTIALAAAASPFAAGNVVAQAQSAHGSCRIVMASYGGTRTVLIRATTGIAVDLVVLSVIPGFETSMAGNFIRTRLPGGVVEGAFANRDLALDRARAICPDAT